MIAPLLPPALAPPAPFPLVLSQTMMQEAIAPGMRRARYDLVTSAGPLVVEAVAIDPREPTVRFGSVVAHDRLVSAGETVSSMARRTGAVAGINADYFDIGQTNQPLNVVVRDGALLRSPSKRIALDVRRDRTIRFENFSFRGSASYGASTVPIVSFNEWPPEGGAALITSDFGPLRSVPGITLTSLVPATPERDPAGPSGLYRAMVPGCAAIPFGGALTLAFGPAARAIAAPPLPGDGVTITTELTPAQRDVVAAVGGGPLLVANGAAALDPNAPAPEERDVRFPVAGAATNPAGTLLLLSVDGRQRTASIGVTRPEFAALMLGFGAAAGMAFDSGGSATLVARVLGDADASVLNAPSDGEERPVADGLFAYSDALPGPAAQLVVRPSSIVALAGVDVPVRLAVVDASGHALGAVHLAAGDVVRGVARSSVVALRAAGLVANVPVRVASQLARIDVTASVRVPEPRASVAFQAVGRDASGALVALGDRVTWSADRGSFIGPGLYRAAERDARIVARAGGASANFDLHVGHHRVALPFFDASHAAAWRFSTAPANMSGSLLVAAPDVLALSYDFTAGVRAAYAATSLALPGEPFVFAIEIEGDGSGTAVRAAFVNALGERRALTLAKNVDWKGWQMRTLALPDDLRAPVRLAALYAVPSLGSAPSSTLGTLRFRNPSVVVAGTP